MFNRIFNCVLAFILLILSTPLLLVLYFIVKITSRGSFIYKQKRMGKGKKIFTMYKIRTMIEGAGMLKSKYMQLNEADGPVFKIRNDPRFTKVGKYIARLGLDELPQLVNVIKGDMALVGPRPLPVEEAKKIPQKYSLRFSVLPGITSLWVIKGGHKLKFNKWMELDLEYIKNRSFCLNVKILLTTIKTIFSV